MNKAKSSDGGLFGAIKKNKGKILGASQEDRTLNTQKEELSSWMRGLEREIELLSRKPHSNRLDLRNWELALLKKVEAFNLYSNWKQFSYLFPHDNEHHNITMQQDFYELLINCNSKEMFLEKFTGTKTPSGEEKANDCQPEGGIQFR